MRALAEVIKIILHDVILKKAKPNCICAVDANAIYRRLFVNGIVDIRLGAEATMKGIG